MRTLVFLAGAAALALAATTAQAADFAPLMDVAHATWPDKTHIGVVANYDNSREEILELAREAGEGSRITVLDLRSSAQLALARNLLVNRVKPDYMVLLPKDTLVHDGSFAATYLVQQSARAGIPTIATTAAAMHQGAVFAVGESTNLEVLVTERMTGTVGVNLPKKGTFLPPVAMLEKGMATISIVNGE
jgi:hypothetical protein